MTKMAAVPGWTGQNPVFVTLSAGREIPTRGVPCVGHTTQEHRGLLTHFSLSLAAIASLPEERMGAGPQ